MTGFCNFLPFSLAGLLVFGFRIGKPVPGDEARHGFRPLRSSVSDTPDYAILQCMYRARVFFACWRPLLRSGLIR